MKHIATLLTLVLASGCTAPTFTGIEGEAGAAGVAGAPGGAGGAGGSSNADSGTGGVAGSAGGSGGSAGSAAGGSSGGSGGNGTDAGGVADAHHVCGPCQFKTSKGFCGTDACATGNGCMYCQNCEGEPTFFYWLVNVVELTPKDGVRYWCGENP